MKPDLATVIQEFRVHCGERPGLWCYLAWLGTWCGWNPGRQEQCQLLLEGIQELRSGDQGWAWLGQ